MLLKLVAELAKAEPEELGGTGLHPLGSIEGFRQDPRLDLVERGVQVHPFLREVEVDPPGLALAADRLRQGVNAEDLPRSEHDGALHDVLQFPDVPRPVVLLQQGERLGGDPPGLLAELLAVLLEEVRDQQRDVLPALPERGEVNGDHVQAVEEVLPERAVAHGGLQVFVGGRDEAHLHLHVLGVPHPPDLPLLDGAQELDLEQGRDFGDLVQEQRSAVGGGEEADLVGHRAREGSLDVPEELGLHEPFRNGSAVDRDERFISPVAVEVDGLGHQLLAGAALARDHHRRVAVGDFPDGVEDLHDLGALADDVLEPVMRL